MPTAPSEPYVPELNATSRLPRKPQRKLTTAERLARRERRRKYMMIFINGKQKRVVRPQTIEGLPVDEFIRRNAGPIWLHQNEMWEYMEFHDERGPRNGAAPPSADMP